MSDNTDTSRMARLVSQARVQMQQARSQYWGEGSSGRVSESTLRDLRSSLLQYYDVLREHRGEKAIKDEWDSKEFDQLPEMISTKVTVESETAGHGSGSSKDTVPYIQTLSAKELVDISYELDDISKELGFSAETDEELPTDKI